MSIHVAKLVLETDSFNLFLHVCLAKYRFANSSLRSYSIFFLFLEIHHKATKIKYHEVFLKGKYNSNRPINDLNHTPPPPFYFNFKILKIFIIISIRTMGVGGGGGDCGVGT